MFFIKLYTFSYFKNVSSLIFLMIIIKWNIRSLFGVSFL